MVCLNHTRVNHEFPLTTDLPPLPMSSGPAPSAPGDFWYHSVSIKRFLLWNMFMNITAPGPRWATPE